MDDDEMEVVAEIKASMLREQLFERIVDLRDHGKSFQEIAKLCGISVRQAWEMLHTKG